MSRKTPAVGERVDPSDLIAVGDMVDAAMLEPETPDAPEAPTASAAPEDAEPGMVSRFMQGYVDRNIGFAKGVGNTIFGLGKIANDYTPVGRITEAIAPGTFDERPSALQPTNANQQIGYTGEQLLEFFVPGGGVGKTAKAIEMAKSAGLTLAQTGSPTAAGVSGALSAAIPGAAAAGRVASSLKEGAQKSVAQALGATKEWAKSEAQKLAPQMLERGVRGTRAQMLERATEASAAAGQRLGQAYQAAAQAGTTISGGTIAGELQAARQAFMVPTASGAPRAIEGTQGVVQKLDDLAEFVGSLGDDIPIDKAAHIKTTWDKIVSKSGLYGQKATATATDNAAAWAVREGAGSFRRLLAEASPDIAALNKEYGFWTGLRRVLKETEQRTQAQGGGLTAGISAAAGGASGFASGDSMGDSLTRAFVGAAVGRQFTKLVQSPYWRTSVSAPLRDKLADALASGSPGKARAALHNIMTALPSQARQALAQ